MLCEACQDHFHHETDRSMGYLRLKVSLVSLARGELDDPSQLRQLELDLRQYERAVRSISNMESQAPCPWYRGDLSSLSWWPRESFEEDCFMAIWKTPRLGYDVKTAGSQGCDICQRLCSVISHMPDFGHISTVRFESWLHFHPISLKPTHIRFLARRPFHHEWLYLRIVENCSENLGDGIAFKQPAGAFSGDEQCLKFLSDSLDTCVRGHCSCIPQNTENWIPSRLLDVDTSSSEPDSVNLVERDKLRELHKNEAIPYLTLSHVWGDESFFTLTESNIQDVKAGVSLQSLRPCFRDAIRITRWLGKRYLWIDSLCIKQDSTEDWNTESASMDRVYQNSFCNLASCQSSDPEEGFFWKRDNRLGGPFSLQWNWLDYTETFTLLFDWFPIVSKHSPLYRRGWVVQERLLSPRTMHFSTFPFWECHEMVTCEAYPSGLRDQQYDWSHVPQKGIMQEDEDPEAFWSRIIQRYSKCELTHFRDKLVALSGVARLVKEKSGRRYLAGLWETNLIQGLMWQVRKHVSGTDMEAERPGEYAAPSWSWASIDGPVVTRRYETSEDLATIVDVDTDPVTSDPFGQVSGSVLIISGMLFVIPVPWALFDPQSHTNMRNLDEWALSFDDVMNIDTAVPEQAFFLPLSKSPDASQSPDLTICGIIVKRSDSPEDSNQYKRIGLAIVNEDDGHIANSGWYLDNWISPPWPETMKRDIEIV